MAAVEDDVDDRFKDIDIETLLSRVERRPLTFHRKKKSVFVAPEFLVRLKGEETVDEGEDLTLNFKVNGVPRPTLRWFKDDEEVKDHARLTVEEGEDGSYSLTLHQVNKGDEAAYRCKAENSEGSCSCCFFLSVKGKPKSPKKTGHKRTVSYPTMFSTIVEKVEEEETAGRETSKAPASPLSHFYDSLTLKGRSTWPEFLGDWAFVNGTQKNRGGSTGSYTSTGSAESDPHYADAAGEDVIRIFADAEGWEPDDVFFDSPTGEGHAPNFTEAPDVVFYIQTPEPPGAHGIGTVPSDADRAPPEAASRGKAGQLLTSAVSREEAAGQSLRTSDLQPENDSKKARGGESSDGGQSVTSSPSPRGETVVNEVGYARGDREGSSPSSSSSSSGASPAAAADTVIKDKQQNVSHGITGDSNASASSSSLPLPAKLNVSSAANSIAPGQTVPAVAPSAAGREPSAPSAKSGIPLRTERNAAVSADTKPSKKSPAVPAAKGEGGSSLQKGFSLSTGSKYASGKPLSVRGPFGSLISSGGDAGTKNTSTTISKNSNSSLTAGKSLASPQRATTTKTNSGSASTLTSPKVSSASKSPTATAGAAICAVPPLVVTPDSHLPQGPQKKRNKTDKMCDCSNKDVHICDCSATDNGSTSSSSSSSGYSSGQDSAGIIVSAPLGEFPFIPPQVVSASSCLQPSSALSPTSARPCPGLTPGGSGSSLLQPEFDREEREPTPIPPDRLIVTHTPTGSSVLVQMYKGPIRPPGVPPRPSHHHLDLHDEDFVATETEVVVVVDSSEKVPAEEKEAEAKGAAKKKATPSSKPVDGAKEAPPPPCSVAKDVRKEIHEVTQAEKDWNAAEEVKIAAASSSREKGVTEEHARLPAADEHVPYSELTTTRAESQHSIGEKPDTVSPVKSPSGSERDVPDTSDASLQLPVSSPAPPSWAEGVEALYFDPVREELVHITKKPVADDEPAGVTKLSAIPKSASKQDSLRDSPLFFKKPGETLFKRPVPLKEQHSQQQPKPQSPSHEPDPQLAQQEPKLGSQTVPEPESEPQQQPELKQESHIKLESVPPTRVEQESKVQPQTQPEPKPQLQIEREPQSEQKSQPHLEPAIESQPKSEPQTHVEQESKVQPQTQQEPKPELQIEREPQSEQKSQPHLQPALKSQPKSESKTRVEQESKVQPQTQPGPKPQLQSEREPQSKEKSQPHLKPALKSQPKSKPQAQLQDQQAPEWFFPAQPTTTSTAPLSHMQALYFDPARQELVHVKRVPEDSEPGRSRSASAVKSSGRGTRRSPSPKSRGKELAQQQQRAKSAVNVASSRTATGLEDDLLCQHLKEAFFLICLFTFICLMLGVSTPVFVGSLLCLCLVVRLGLLFSRHFCFDRK